MGVKCIIKLLTPTLALPLRGGGNVQVITRLTVRKSREMIPEMDLLYSHVYDATEEYHELYICYPP